MTRFGCLARALEINNGIVTHALFREVLPFKNDVDERDSCLDYRWLRFQRRRRYPGVSVEVFPKPTTEYCRKADFRTFAAHGCYGTSVITAMTAQNTTGVQAVHGAPPEFVVQQACVPPSYPQRVCV